MAELQPLLQALTDRCIPAEDLSFGRALRLFASLLDSIPLQVRHLCELPPDNEHETADQDAWKQRQGYWSTEQLNLVFAIAEAVIVQFWNISPESGVAESIGAVFRSILLSCVESLKSIGCCMKLQDRPGLLYEQVSDKLLLILELALVEDKVKEQRPVFLGYSSELLQEFVMNEISEDTLHESPSKYSVEMSLNGNPEVEEVFDDMMRLLSADLSWMKGGMSSSKKQKFEMKTMQQAAVQLSLNPESSAKWSFLELESTNQ